MKRYFKISESELVELLADSLRLQHLDNAGVDNWDSGGLIQYWFRKSCKGAGLPDPEDSYWCYSYRDLAQAYLKDYPEVN